MKLYAILITIGFVIYIYSQPVEGRYFSTFRALTGNIDHQYDSSGAARLYRANIAINSIKQNPMGTGWGSQGWVHSDILQIGASVGVFTGAILFISPIMLFFKIYRAYKKAYNIDQTALFVSMSLLIYTTVSLTLNGNIFLIQSGAPLFVAWAISYAYSQQYSTNKNHLVIN